MKAQEKAEELFRKMYFIEDTDGNYPMCVNTATQCALIIVDEILEEVDTLSRFKYWKKVKEEIKKL